MTAAPAAASTCVARQGLNTLADFRYQRTFKGDNGQPGGSADCSGRGGEDLEIVVPIGTVVYDTETDETLGDLTHDGERMLRRARVAAAASATSISRAARTARRARRRPATPARSASCGSSSS